MLYVPTKVTWPVYFVELVRTLEEQRRREQDKAAAELENELLSDGMMSDEDSSSSSDNGSDRSLRARSSTKSKPGGDADEDGEDGDSDESEEEEEEDGEERDPLETLCLAFQAGEHHLLPLEMKVQALEYLVDRAMEVRAARGNILIYVVCLVAAAAFEAYR